VVPARVELLKTGFFLSRISRAGAARSLERGLFGEGTRRPEGDAVDDRCQSTPSAAAELDVIAERQR
jgi:hypothetical protein